ncbi:MULTISPECIES: serine hydrolase domain-containing protein [unclassified Sphingobacterium]|uniref:serine hydrolase domain-containing protein n=1 Tax=unclassified Sphingobacterium TaxID=2609468 RepID=UPI0025F1CBC4|nr:MULTISPECIES: serine hydrolase domain-containing protein [unclassified Sphingobacterium]
MKKINIILVLSVLVNICFAQQQQKQSKQLDSIFSMMNEQNQFNGVVLIADKGNILLEKGYGYSNEATKEYNNPETIFELGAASKQFTAAAIVLLKRQGKLHYEDSIEKYLPELGFWNKVTIYDLLRHTSGLPEFIIDMPKQWDDSRIATNDDLIRFYAERKDSLQFKPKNLYRYNNTGYALLATIIERVSGEKYADFMADHIFKPLKMNSTFVYNSRLHPRNIKNYATGYVWARNSFRKVVPEDTAYNEKKVYFLDGIVGAAKISSNVKDIYSWFNALEANTLLSKQEFEEMTEVTQNAYGKNIPYGFGFDLTKKENIFTYGNVGNWGGYVALLYRDVVKDRMVLVLENFKLGSYPFNNITQILENRPLKTEFRKKVQLSEADIKKYEGRYKDNRDPDEDHMVTYVDGHLIYNTSRTRLDLRFYPVSANEFQGIRQGGMDSALKFTVLENGNIKLQMSEYADTIATGIKTTK